MEHFESFGWLGLSSSDLEPKAMEEELLQGPEISEHTEKHLPEKLGEGHVQVLKLLILHFYLL